MYGRPACSGGDNVDVHTATAPPALTAAGRTAPPPPPLTVRLGQRARSGVPCCYTLASSAHPFRGDFEGGGFRSPHISLEASAARADPYGLTRCDSPDESRGATHREAHPTPAQPQPVAARAPCVARLLGRSLPACLPRHAGVPRDLFQGDTHFHFTPSFPLHPRHSPFSPPKNCRLPRVTSCK